MRWLPCNGGVQAMPSTTDSRVAGTCVVGQTPLSARKNGRPQERAGNIHAQHDGLAMTPADVERGRDIGRQMHVTTRLRCQSSRRIASRTRVAVP